MTYLSLGRTASTDLVTPVEALDNNWDQIDSKFALMDSHTTPVGTGVVNPDTGMEVVSSGTVPPQINVYDGSTYSAIAGSETWGAWTNITLATNYNPVTGRTPQISMSNHAHVKCRGAVQYQAGSTAWPAGYVLINSGQFASASYSPNQAIVQNQAATPTHTTTWVYGQAFVTSSGGFLNIYLMFVGTPTASGNYISLDSLRWHR